MSHKEIPYEERRSGCDDASPSFARLNADGRFEQLMSALGLGPGEFDAIEKNRFDSMGAERWLRQRLEKLDWVQGAHMLAASAAQPTECPRSCCQGAK